MNDKNICTLRELIDRVANCGDISINIFMAGEVTSISIYPHPDPADEPKNPTAEAYKFLLAGDTASALVCLEEALAE
jgi:hypothetical protein